MKNEMQYLRFKGLNAPLCITAPDAVRPLMDPIFQAWPAHETAKDTSPPYATIGPVSQRHWELRAPQATNPIARHNPVNAICDLVVEISWERLRSQPHLLCLHAAAVQFADRLVIFPNARRAGKSLLSATLVRLGHSVFSDDFVPLAVDPDTGAISGMANGIAPRLRLPLPPNISASLADWITARIGPANKQYGYLTGIDLPMSGVTAPVGSVVVLDRDPDMTHPATLEPIGQDEAMAALVTQNFGRQVHAGAILRVTDAVTRGLPVLRLRYRDVEEAATLLSTSEALHDLPRAHVPDLAANGPLPLAPQGAKKAVRQSQVHPDDSYCKQSGYTEVETESGLYLADGAGVMIHRLNPVSAIIWKLLDAPLSQPALLELLQQIYPDVDPSQLGGDLLGALGFLLKHGLISSLADGG